MPRSDTDHLGVVVGRQDGPRIVALATSAVFSEPSLLRTYWHTDAAHLDSGIQAHLYTRPQDILVVKVPDGAADPARRIGAALDANAAVWRRHAGIELATSGSRIVLVTGSGPPVVRSAVPSTTWFHGTLIDAVAETWASGVGSVLAFVLSEEFLDRLPPSAADLDLARRARVVSQLMDKNVAMGILAAGGVDCPLTVVHPAVDGSSDLHLPEGLRYVFKPAGGAAGVGVFTDNGRGADVATLTGHIADLRAAGVLPRRFQVQEFLSGPVLGASIWLDGAGGCRVLEIHRQTIDGSGRFQGARWTRTGEATHVAAVRAIGEAMSVALGVPLLVGIDLVDGRVIEVNPRLTASAPIAHLLRHEESLGRALPGGSIESIDLDVRVPIASGSRLATAVDRVRQQHGTLVLPQGINPYGSTRVAIVNDDEAGSARSAFVHLVAG